MSISNFKPTVWSARLLAQLDKQLVLPALANRDYEGEVRYGTGVKIQRPGRVGTKPYSPGSTSVTYDTPVSSTRQLAIDQRSHFAIALDDLDQVQANVNLIDAYTLESAYSLADDIDRYLASLYTGAGAGDAAINLTSYTSGDVYKLFVNAGKLLDNQNVASHDRWAVVSPALYAECLNDPKFTAASSLGDQTVQNGLIGTIAGFTLVKSNNLTGSGIGITTSAAAAAGATSLAVTSLAGSIPAGTVLTFGGGTYAVTTAAAAAAATSISVQALDVAIPSGSGTTYIKTRKCLFGTRAAITYAEQDLPTVEAIRLEGKFADGLRGEIAFGALVVEPRALGTITATEAA